MTRDCWIIALYLPEVGAVTLVGYMALYGLALAWGWA